ncbi:MAG: hypothetical protein ACTHJ0_13410 [Flavipsychrobacter sp.]
MQRVYLFLAILIVTFSACKKGGSGNNPISISEYPLKVNNQWTYKVTDSVNNMVDTMVLKITASRTKGDTTWWYCNVYEHNMVIDTPVYIQTSTTIGFANSSYTEFSPDFFIDFPVSNNSVWIASSLITDTAVVNLLSSSVMVGGRSYSNVYMISRSYYMVDFSFRQSIYVSRGIGLIAENYAIMPFGPQVRKSIELISYSLN